MMAKSKLKSWAEIKSGKEKALTAWTRKAAQAPINNLGDRNIIGEERSLLKRTYGSSVEAYVDHKTGKTVVHYDNVAGGKTIGEFDSLDHAIKTRVAEKAKWAEEKAKAAKEKTKSESTGDDDIVRDDKGRFAKK